METCQPATSYSLDLSSMVGGQHAGLDAGYPQTGGSRRRSTRRRSARRRSTRRRSTRRR